jgi:Transmembrane amino acid transporter protein
MEPADAQFDPNEHDPLVGAARTHARSNARTDTLPTPPWEQREGQGYRKKRVGRRGGDEHAMAGGGVGTGPAASVQEVGWLTMSFVLMSDQIGYGILSLPKAYANLGYLGGSFAVLLLGALTTYTGLLLVRIRRDNPKMTSYRQLFRETFSPTVGAYASVCVK